MTEPGHETRPPEVSPITLQREALEKILQSPSIVSDKGKKVFGWEVRDPHRAALNHIEQAIESLSGIPGSEKIIARGYETSGDLAAQDDKKPDGNLVAKHDYMKAAELLLQVGDVDGAVRILNKKLQIK